MLSILKLEGLKDKERKVQIEALSLRISEEEFSTLLNLAKELTDYTTEIEDP